MKNPGLRLSGAWAVVVASVALAYVAAGAPAVAAVQSAGMQRPCRLRSPTWSPDGTQIAFSADDGLSHKVYVLDVDGGAAPRVLRRGVWWPRWSPSGSQILVTRYANGAAALMNVDGGGGLEFFPPSLTSSSPDAAWSPNGERLAMAGSGSQVTFVGTDGRGSRRLTKQATDPEAGYGSPAWSPRGPNHRRAAERRRAPGCVRLARPGVLGRTKRKDPPQTRAERLGSDVLVARRPRDRNSGPLYIIRKGTLRSRLLLPKRFRVGSLAWSPDGASIAYTTGENAGCRRASSSTLRRARLDDSCKQERKMIIPALDDPPPGLEELRRAVLLREHVGQVRDGLV